MIPYLIVYSINQSINQSVNQSVNQSINRSINSANDSSLHFSPINQSINRSQAINQSIDQLIVYSTLWLILFFFSSISSRRNTGSHLFGALTVTLLRHSFLLFMPVSHMAAYLVVGLQRKCRSTTPTGKQQPFVHHFHGTARFERRRSPTVSRQRRGPPQWTMAQFGGLTPAGRLFPPQRGMRTACATDRCTQLILEMRKTNCVDFSPWFPPIGIDLHTKQPVFFLLLGYSMVLRVSAVQQFASPGSILLPEMEFLYHFSCE